MNYDYQNLKINYDNKYYNGLGNQMFQWAYGRSLEVKYGKKMFLETSSYPSYHRTYSMNKFPNMTSEVYVPALRNV
jgi:hypothetical protein